MKLQTHILDEVLNNFVLYQNLGVMWFYNSITHTVCYTYSVAVYAFIGVPVVQTVKHATCNANARTNKMYTLNASFTENAIP